MRRQQMTSLDARMAGDEKPTVDQLVESWLDSVRNRHTRNAYRSTIEQFRRELRLAEWDLDSDPVIVSEVAALWAGRAADGTAVAGSTSMQRLSRLSSFFGWWRRRGDGSSSNDRNDDDGLG